MANTVRNIAIISMPRTGSKSLATSFAEKLNKPVGHIHASSFVGNEKLTDDQILSNEFVLHGHWHTINLYPDHVLEHLRNNYEIHNIERDIDHRLASTLLMMTQDGEITKQHIEIYVDMERQSCDEIKHWNYVSHNFDELYNNTSLSNFEKNLELIPNWTDVVDIVHQLYHNN